MTTTTQGLGDSYDEIERNIDWIERLERVRTRHDRAVAIRAAIQYVEQLRQIISDLAGPLTAAELAQHCGSEPAKTAQAIGQGAPDAWTERIKPALLSED